MGYDGQIFIIKKKTIEKVKELFPNETFTDIYSNYLFAFKYPKKYIIPKDEEIKEVVWFNSNVFEDYFVNTPLKNDEARIIEKDVFEDFKKWIETKIKMLTLFDIVTEQVSTHQADNYINIYLALQDVTIDWNTECIVFQHDW